MTLLQKLDREIRRLEDEVRDSIGPSYLGRKDSWTGRVNDDYDFEAADMRDLLIEVRAELAK